MRSLLLNPLRILRHQPQQPSTAIAPRIASNVLVEEENSPFYKPSYFYPARLGEILHNRYQLATKLGHGSRSTIWLARDLEQWRFQQEQYITLKINSNDPSRTGEASAEVGLLQKISSLDSSQHPGWSFVRKLKDEFTIQSATGTGSHVCLVFAPLRETLETYRTRYRGQAIPVSLLKIMLQMMLHALDYLHSQCHIIHTDLKPGNDMVKLEDKSLLHKDALDEYEHPVPQKHCEDGRIIYTARRNYGAPKTVTGLIEITDFDLAVSGDVENDGAIQAGIYRAPEVIVDAGFSYPADIWSLGALIWDLIEAKSLFKVVDPRVGNEYDDAIHLAHITALLGPPPDDLLQHGKRTNLFYRNDSAFQLEAPVPSDFTFESSLSLISGEEKKRLLLFIQRMLKWRPEDRSTAKELLDDPWLHEKFN